MTATILTRFRNWASFTAPLLLVICLAIVVINYLGYRNLRDEAHSQQRDAYLSATQAAADSVEQLIQSVQQTAEALAAAVGNGSLPRAEYESALAAMLSADDRFYGGTIAFAPYAYDPSRRLYAPYFWKQDGALEFMYIEQGYDYTLEDQEWFGQAMSLGSRWSQPYFDESVGNILMTTYSAVVYWPDETGQRRAVAVVTIDIALDAIGDTVESLGVGGAGYAEIVTDRGLYIYSPEEARVLDQEVLFASERWVHDNNFERLQELVATGGKGVVEVFDPVGTGLDWVTVAVIPSAGWCILGNFAAVEVDPRSAALRHRLLLVVLGVVLGLCILLLYKQVVTPRGAVLSWSTSMLVSLVFAVGVAQVWHIATQYASGKDRSLYAINGKQAIAREVSYLTQRSKEHLTLMPSFVPTGIYVESMKFLSPTDIQLVGSVWQKFNVSKHQDLARGVIFPGAATVRMAEVFVSSDDETELVRRQFQADLRVNLDYSRYPLVKDLVGIGLFPRDNNENVLLVPDVSSFPYMAPSSLPGLSRDVFLPGWRIQNSYFELRPWSYQTTFGEKESLANENLPELYFTIQLQKAFSHAIISYLTPLGIAGLIAFFTLLVSTPDKSKLEQLRTGVSFDIGISTSIFFVVVLSHIGLRERIVSEEVFYLEYFYLLMYGNLIWICCRSILSGLEYPLLSKMTFGVTAKKAFFPVNSFLVFGFTWLSFYY